MKRRKVKPEARIAFIACSGNCCCVVVLRAGKLIDWVACGAYSEPVELLCVSSVSGETRYHIECTEGVPTPSCTEGLERGDTTACTFVQRLAELVKQYGCRRAWG